MDFKEKLKDFRKSKSLTQKEFAEKYGFSRTTITELESGRKKPTLKMIEKLSNSTNTKKYYWIDTEEGNVSYQNFDGLEMVIKKLISTGDISKNGSMNDKAKSLLIKMLEAEIKLLLKEKN